MSYLIANALTCAHGATPCHHLPYTGISLVFFVPIFALLAVTGFVLHRANR